MKVILVKDVARLGRKSEIKDVPDGHALNFLIPKKMAIIATPDQIRRVREEVKKHDEHSEQAQQNFSAICDSLKNKKVTISVEANDQGHLFKGINAQDVVAYLNSGEGISIDVAMVKLDHPIKSLGIHEVALSYKGIQGVCTLEVVKK